MKRGDFLALTALALLARGLASLVVDDPPYVDPAYYELVARQLVAGDGFTSPALWSFLEVGGRLPPDPALPVPSNGHWMPLTSIVAAGSMMLFGTSRLAAELPMVLAGTALVPLTALVGWELWGSRRIALSSGILAVFAGPMLVFLPMVESFAIFGLGGFAAIYGSIRVLRAPGRAQWLMLAALGVGIATLTRIDGVVLAVAPAVAWLARNGIGPWRVALPPLPPRWALACAGVALIVVLPWLVRQQLVFGTPLPSTGGHTLWITTFNEQFSIGHEVNLGTYLASGAPAIIGSKLESWALVIGRTAVLLGGTFLFSFAYGLWRERARPELAPFLVYWLILFALMGGVFTLHAPFGAWYHSGWAWLPFAIPLAANAFMPGAVALGRRVPILSRERNQRFLFVAALAGAVVLSLVSTASLMVGWRADTSRLETASDFLMRHSGPSDVVMHVNAPGIALRTDRMAVAPPFDPYPVIETVVAAYDVTWVVVERPSGMGTDPLGLWDGPTALDADGNRPRFLAEEPAYDSDTIRIYRTVPDDG